MPSLLKKDRDHACRSLEAIETDLAFELIDANEDRRVDDFASSLLVVRDLIEVRKAVCREDWARV